MKILIVEDSNNLSDIYKQIIEEAVKKNGFCKKVNPLVIDTIEDVEGFQNLNDSTYDMAIIDWMLKRETAEPIVKIIYNNCKYISVITGYPKNKKLSSCCKKYGIPEERINDKFLSLEKIENIFRAAVDVL